MPQQGKGGVDRRHRLMVDRSAQGHLIRFLALLVLAAMVVFAVITLYGAQHGEQTSTIKMLVSLLLALIMMLIGVVYIGLRFSNKIVGPIYNFGRNLQLIQRGDYTSEVRLRHGDEFQNMAGVFNLALESLRERIREDVRFLDEIAAELEKSTADAARKEPALRMIRDFRAAKERYVTKPPTA